MNDKDWEDNPGFWDDEEHDDDDDEGEYNGHGNDVDANNDETFDNAAEWNEDEHEELIARDLILSHRTSPPKQSAARQPPPPQQPPPVPQLLPIPPQPTVLTVDELERQLLKTSINQNAQQTRAPKAQTETSRRAGWSPFGGKDLFKRDDPRSAGPASMFDPGSFQSMEPKTLTLEQQQRLILQQQQRLILQQQQLLQQHQLQHQHQQNQQQSYHEQQHLQNQQLQQNQQPKHFAFFAQHQPLRPEPKTTPAPVRCFTVEELERQMLASRSENALQREQEPFRMVDKAPEAPERTTRNQEPTRHHEETRSRNFQEKRNGERQDRYDRHNRDNNDSRDYYKDKRETRSHKENYRSHRKEPTIIPPQVQLSVISEAKRRHSITAMHHDEFIRDRMPNSGEGFRFLRHSQVAANKVKHDGVLTDKERDWLTRIQEKIQADYDNNLDQDYYYLLYFNRSSMTDEAAQKPSGHGVFDRRFIPRERLLYNSGV